MLAEPIDKSYSWAVGFYFINTESCMEFWTVSARISVFDD